MGYLNMILLLHCFHWHNFTILGDSYSGKLIYFSLQELPKKTLQHFNRKFIPWKHFWISCFKIHHLVLSPVLNYYILIFTNDLNQVLHWNTYLKLNLASEIQTKLYRVGVLLTVIISSALFIQQAVLVRFGNIICSICIYSIMHTL